MYKSVRSRSAVLCYRSDWLSNIGKAEYLLEKIGFSRSIDLCIIIIIRKDLPTGQMVPPLPWFKPSLEASSLPRAQLFANPSTKTLHRVRETINIEEAFDVTRVSTSGQYASPEAFAFCQGSFFFRLSSKRHDICVAMPVSPCGWSQLFL